MKKIHKIIIFAAVLLIIFITLITIDNNKEIKSVRSEKQLLEFYNRGYGNNLSLAERMLTLPFSATYYNRHYAYDKGYAIEDAMINEGETQSGTSSKDYSKTNIQVEDVDEADIIKTDGDYIYSISENNVVITNVKDPSNPVIEARLNGGSGIPSDLLTYNNYLVVISYSDNNTYRYNSNTLVEVYDISNRSKPIRVKSFELYETYYTSRCIDGNLYIFSNGYLRKENDRIVREYKEDYETQEISLKDIKYLKDNNTNMQTLIAHFNLNTLNEVNVQSYLIDISNAYVSKDNVYLLDYAYYDDYISPWKVFTFRGVIGFIKDQTDIDYSTDTLVYKFEINKDKGVEYKAKTKVKGSIVNQYSLDEKNNHLRIALYSTDDGTRISILDEKLNLIGETPNVAKGERMYASRFIGDKAYLVTYKNTDPLFAIDLSDERNPKVMGELKIPGYSTYLHPYDENHLIGIGYDTEEIINRNANGNVISSWVRTNGMKMCLFDISDINNPIEVAKTTLGDSRVSSAILSNPKALLFSKERNLLAIPVNNYSEEETDEYSRKINDYIAEGYFVYNLDLESGFNLKGIINHEKLTRNNYYYYYGDSKLLRGVYIDDNLYSVSESYLKVNKIEDLTEISSLRIKE